MYTSHWPQVGMSLLSLGWLAALFPLASHISPFLADGHTGLYLHSSPAQSLRPASDLDKKLALQLQGKTSDEYIS